MRDEYLKIKNEINLGSHKEILDLIKKSEKIWVENPRKNMSIVHSNDCTGNFIINSKNCKNVWHIEECENSKYLYNTAWEKECMDNTSSGQDELCYLCGSGGGLYNSIAVLYSFGKDVKKTKHSFNCGYSYTVLGCSDCFGCVGLRNKKYCILNKQYTKEEYEDLLPKIKKHMIDMPYIDKMGKIYKYGDFFPNEFLLFSYNETVANDYYHKTKIEAEKEGFLWRGEQENEYNFSDYKIPDDIKDVKDDILEKVLKCKITGKAFRITKQELIFYRKMNLPIPRISPFVRIRERVQSLPPFSLFNRNCDKCGVEIKSSYSKDRPETIYCESCYNKEVY